MKKARSRVNAQQLVEQAWQKVGFDIAECAIRAEELQKEGERTNSSMLVAEAALLRCYATGEEGDFNGALLQLQQIEQQFPALPLNTSLRLAIYRGRLLSQTGNQEAAGNLFAEIEMQLEQAADDIRAFYYEVAEDFYEYHNLPKAFDCIVKGSIIAENRGDFARLAYFNFTRGLLYYKNGEKEQAIEQLQTLLPFLEQHDILQTQLDTLYSLAQIFANEKQFDNSLHYAEKGLELALKNGTPLSISKAYLAVLDATVETGRFNEARQAGYKAIRFIEEAALDGQLAHVQLHLGRACAGLQNFAEAEDLLTSAYNNFKLKANKHYLRLVTKVLADLYEQQGDFARALDFYKQSMAYKEELMNESAQRNLSALRLRYEAGKKDAELRELKIKQQQAELQRTESELKAIKAQMNPHFIFNALNSIQEMFLVGDKRLANEHLGKFSQLTRDILNASCQTSISLTEEINMLHHYLQLEALRFEHGFSYAISFDKQQLADAIHMPPMLLQPYVENSIRHGLLHKKGEKHIRIGFRLSNDNKKLICEITDNGIGRTQAALLSSNTRPLHQSFSSAANERRLDLLNQSRDEQIGVVYHDQPIGTRVVVTIPIQL